MASCPNPTKKCTDSGISENLPCGTSKAGDIAPKRGRVNPELHAESTVTLAAVLMWTLPGPHDGKSGPGVCRQQEVWVGASGIPGALYLSASPNKLGKTIPSLGIHSSQDDVFEMSAGDSGPAKG